MKIIDLTHTISPDMLVYPGTEPPVLTTESTIEETGFLEKKITMFSHTGTHMDAPAHIIKDAKTLDLLPIEQFYGKAFLLDLLKAKTDLKSETIDIKELEPHQESIEQGDDLPSVPPIEADDILREIKITSERISTVSGNLIDITRKMSQGEGIFGKVFTDTACDFVIVHYILS